ncbi:putative meiotic recombination protein dmc1 protein [Phaeoacremonium minimum UCRPA7]|uniref:Putative meiotic recombination protein dmc1 protein n=1 Tax=Phaeoacremonium minimum (strain UCR-PA7) TaxID=1286976 RepID=R8BJH4_PHAM7|nr:putative meiotic recombination protein dmc1 protein [Phaeoacremonium minimum UCRPA7]EON99466.1 putative meiotic recombination protein dmc1 protein [Phaeoacremonium minimum UCRPA7]
MSELCKDVEALINIIWLSGTPSLQVPHLLNIAGELTTWVTSFAPSPPATFAVLRKLDHCFASLLSGRDIESKEPLPGFENGTGAGMTRTEMVRCKSLVEQTRVLIVDIMNKEPEDEDGGGDENDDDDDVETGDETETGTNGTGSFTDPNWDEGDDTLHMDVARVYENTIVQLGEILGEGVSGGI